MLSSKISCNSSKYTGKPSDKSACEFNSVQHFTQIHSKSKTANLFHKQVLESQNLKRATIFSSPSPSFYRSEAGPPWFGYLVGKHGPEQVNSNFRWNFQASWRSRTLYCPCRETGFQNTDSQGWVLDYVVPVSCNIDVNVWH